MPSKAVLLPYCNIPLSLIFIWASLVSNLQMRKMIPAYWERWRYSRRRKKFLKLIQRQRQIVKTGIYIRARVMKLYKSNQSFAGWFLLRIHICIQLPDQTNLYALSTFLSQKETPLLEGTSVAIRLLPGDLSQIVLVI